MAKAAEMTGDVPALRKGLFVVDLLARDGALTMAEIQRRGGLNKTMAFRILRTLREEGYVRHDQETHRFALSYRLMELGATVASQLTVVSVGQPLLDDLRLRFGETANLGVMEGGSIVYVGIAESSHRGLRMAPHVGGRDHLHSTAIGKAMLAYLPQDRKAETLEQVELVAITPNTIIDDEQFCREVGQTRARGYAVDNEENERGARCIGVPVLDSQGVPFAGLSVSGPKGRISDELIELIAEALWSASEDISRQLGHAIPSGALGLNAASAHTAADCNREG
jgi:IclR family acetate operon transcriptional repressor